MGLPLRILTVNQNRMLREGICMLLEMEPSLELLGASDSPEAAPNLFTEKKPDLVLIDVDFPHHGGLDSIRRILAIDPDAWIIGLATHEWEACGPEALQAGVSTVITKDLIADGLLALIRAGRPREFVAPERVG